MWPLLKGTLFTAVTWVAGSLIGSKVTESMGIQFPQVPNPAAQPQNNPAAGPQKPVATSPSVAYAPAPSADRGQLFLGQAFASILGKMANDAQLEQNTMTRVGLPANTQKMDYLRDAAKPGSDAYNLMISELGNFDFAQLTTNPNEFKRFAEAVSHKIDLHYALENRDALQHQRETLVAQLDTIPRGWLGGDSNAAERKQISEKIASLDGTLVSLGEGITAPTNLPNIDQKAYVAARSEGRSRSHTA